MKNFKKTMSHFSVMIAILAFTSGVATATTLTGGLNVDNFFSAYISTDDSVQGALIGSGVHWPTMVPVSGALLAGQDDFLHISATDMGWIAGVLGEFSLSGTDHILSNGLSQLTTNTTDWSVSTTGWNNYVAASAFGSNGVSPWYFRSGVSHTAEWIWASDAFLIDQVYLSTAIQSTTTPASVPEPGVMMLLGTALVALVGLNYKRQNLVSQT